MLLQQMFLAERSDEGDRSLGGSGMPGPLNTCIDGFSFTLEEQIVPPSLPTLSQCLILAA